MTTQTLSDREQDLVNAIKEGNNPLRPGVEFYAHAVVKGVHEEDIAFLIPFKETTDQVFDDLMKWVARELSDTPLPGTIPLLERVGRRPFSYWLEQHYHSLYLRARTIVIEGLKPWEAAAVTEYDDYCAAAQKVLDSLLQQRC